MDALIDYRGKTPTKTTSGIPLVTAKIIKGGRIEKPTEFISAEEYETWMRRGIPKPGDVVLTTEAPLGEVAQLGSEKVALAQRVITLRGKAGLLDSSYLLYLLQTEEMQAQLKARATGTTVLGIKQSELRKVTVALLPYAQQFKAAAILSALDKRISLLRETNATLEAIAQALFKSWFVDFDPVRAKAEGREPEGLDADTAALFPDGFEESDSGLVPREWRLVPFGQLLNHTIGGDWGDEIPNEKNDTRVGIIRGTDIPDLQGGQAERVPIRFTSQKKLASRRLQDGDLVLEVSGGSKDQPTGRTLYVTDGVLEQFDCPVAPATFCRLLRPISREVGVLLGQHMSYIYRQGKTWEYQNQSTGISNFQTTHFLEAELVALPPPQVLHAFSEIVRVAIDRGRTTQIVQLSAIRDTLLPRLISGQLRIPEAEAMLEDAA
ncbi:restriction endonuclease subunit S [Paraburkholderia youngii]|uniref:restriction endonuclease subunit S n=1 Tax=Paraburkholderia youngii TaxID=2782701 RepID=UPI003D21E7EC